MKSSLLRDHSSNTSAKRWVGGFRKWHFLLIYTTIYADVSGWVGLKKPKTCWSNTWMVPKPKTTAWKLILICEQFPKLKSSTLLRFLFTLWNKMNVEAFLQHTELEFVSFLSGGFTIAILVNGQEKTPANPTSVYEFLSFLKIHWKLIWWILIFTLTDS